MLCAPAQGEHGTRGHPPSTLRAVHVQRRSPTSYQLPGLPSLAVASGAQCPLTGVYPRGLSEACRAEGSHVGLHKPLPRERQDVARRALCRRPSSVSITSSLEMDFLSASAAGAGILMVVMD